jgi:hypothetical protein
MPNKNINPTLAVQTLTEMIDMAGGELTCTAGDVSDQMAYIASLPEAEERFTVTWYGEQATIRFIRQEIGGDHE